MPTFSFKRLIPFLALFCCIPTHGAVTFNSVTVPTGNSPWTVTTSTGNLYVVLISDDTADTVSACSTNKGSMTLYASHATSTQGQTWLCYALSSAAGVTTVTVTHSGGGIGIAAYDLSSTSGGALDGSPVLYNSQPSSQPILAVTAAGAGVALAVESGAQNNSSVSSPWTFDRINAGQIAAGNGAAHNQNASGGTQTATFGSTVGTWCGLIVEFKEAVPSSCTPSLSLIGVGVCS